MPHRPWSAPELIEPRVFVGRMWSALNAANYPETVQWAERTIVGEPHWVELAHRDTRQNVVDVGNLIFDPWGRTSPGNSGVLHDAIGKYRLLNEVGAAMAGAIIANYRMSRQAPAADDSYAPQRYKEAVKSWMRRMILEASLHQVAVTKLDETTGEMESIYGYWNAIVSWLYYPEVMTDGPGLNALMKEVLEQLRVEGLQERKDYYLPSPSGVHLVEGDETPPAWPQRT